LKATHWKGVHFRGIRPETLNRIEHGKHAPNVRTIDKIDPALKKAGREENGRG